MTHPSIGEIILSCFVFFAFIAFIVAHSLLAAKRIVAWFDRRQKLSNPPSVQQTLNILNIDGDGSDYNKSRHARIERG